MTDDSTENTPWREGENCDETMSEEPFDEEEEFDAEEAERHITQFITSAEELPGPSVEELAERVSALMQAALRDLEKLMDGKPHNKVLATQLLLGQRARGLQQHDPEQRHLQAATTLLGGIVVRGAQR
jgi:hypothetical protein